MNRHEAKIEFHAKLGMVFKPLVAITSGTGEPTRDVQVRALGQFAAEIPTLVGEFRAFCDAEPGHRYEVEAQKFALAVDGLLSVVARVEGHNLKELVAAHMARAHDAIDSIPTNPTSAILAEGRPFSAYMELRGYFAGARKSMVIVDPYLDQSVFYRYLSAIEDGVRTTLVAASPPTNSGGKAAQRWREFLDVSRLFAAEKGSALYRLIVYGAGLHDRWMLVDDTTLLTLGGSLKDAGRSAFTLTPIAADAANIQAVKNVISGGSELFGPNAPVHG